jgi:hypothetical protein
MNYKRFDLGQSMSTLIYKASSNKQVHMIDRSLRTKATISCSDIFLFQGALPKSFKPVQTDGIETVSGQQQSPSKPGDQQL